MRHTRDSTTSEPYRNHPGGPSRVMLTWLVGYICLYGPCVCMVHAEAGFDSAAACPRHAEKAGAGSNSTIVITAI